MSISPEKSAAHKLAADRLWIIKKLGEQVERLGAENKRLLVEVVRQMKWKTEAQDENERLREALEGLVEAAEQAPGMGPCIALDLARAAISKAEEVKPQRIEGYNTNRDQPTVTIKEVKP